MKTTAERELQFLQEGLQNGVLNDQLAAATDIVRMRDLLGVGIAAVAAEIEPPSGAELRLAQPS